MEITFHASARGKTVGEDLRTFIHSLDAAAINQGWYGSTSEIYIPTDEHGEVADTATCSLEVDIVDTEVRDRELYDVLIAFANGIAASMNAEMDIHISPHLTPQQPSRSRSSQRYF